MVRSHNWPGIRSPKPKFKDIFFNYWCPYQIPMASYWPFKNCRHGAITNVFGGTGSRADLATWTEMAGGWSLQDGCEKGVWKAQQGPGRLFWLEACSVIFWIGFGSWIWNPCGSLVKICESMIPHDLGSKPFNRIPKSIFGFTKMFVCRQNEFLWNMIGWEMSVWVLWCLLNLFYPPYMGYSKTNWSKFQENYTTAHSFKTT